MVSAAQLDESEPLVRVGLDRVDPPAFDREGFFDSYLDYHQRIAGSA